MPYAWFQHGPLLASLILLAVMALTMGVCLLIFYYLEHRTLREKYKKSKKKRKRQNSKSTPEVADRHSDEEIGVPAWMSDFPNYHPPQYLAPYDRRSDRHTEYSAEIKESRPKRDAPREQTRDQLTTEPPEPERSTTDHSRRPTLPDHWRHPTDDKDTNRGYYADSDTSSYDSGSYTDSHDSLEYHYPHNERPRKQDQRGYERY